MFSIIGLGVRSRHVVGWVNSESFWLFGPASVDVLVWRKAAEGFKPPGIVVGGDEVREVCTELIVIGVVVSPNGSLLDGPVHSLDLAVRPRVINLGQSVLDPVLLADAVEDVMEGGAVAASVGELHAVVGENRVDAVGDGFDKIPEELGGSHLAGLLDKADKGELRGPVDGDEQIELAFLRPHLGDVDVNVADGISLEAGPLGLVAVNVRQTADLMALKQPVQR